MAYNDGMAPLHGLLLRLALLLLLALPARATWSVVALDRATGEVCVASATCISGFNLKRWVPVLVVGKGGAAAQSVPDASGDNRLLVRDLLLADASAEEILAALAASDSSHQTRQYGIAAFPGAPVTFTGFGAGDAALGVVGRVGTIEYAIQGNVLAGDAVVHVAEAAFRGTDGDLSQRVMAAMEGARAMGGDGRCSCDSLAPTSCGSPPDDFEKSAHAAFIVSARPGDTDGACDTASGCADGSYYLKRNVIQQASEPDPVIELSRRYARWRELKAALPDHVLTEVEASAPRLPADGLTTSTVTVRLVNLEGVALTSGGQGLSIENLGPAQVAIGSPLDLGDGTHRFEVTAGPDVGQARLRIVVSEGNAQVQLVPDLELTLDPAADLHASHAALSAAAGEEVALTLDRGAAEAGRPYLLLAGASGTFPGTPFGGGTLPLNDDRILRWFVSGPSVLQDGSGTLDAVGRARALLIAPPGLLAPLVPGRLDLCAVLGSTPVDFTTVVGLDLLP